MSQKPAQIFRFKSWHQFSMLFFHSDCNLTDAIKSWPSKLTVMPSTLHFYQYYGKRKKMNLSICLFQSCARLKSPPNRTRSNQSKTGPDFWSHFGVTRYIILR